MLTLGQNRVYQFIISFYKEQGYAPSTGEIAEGIGIQSRGVAHRYIKALESHGLIQLVPGKKRNIRLLDTDNQQRFQMPLLGKIAAGQPIAAILDEDTVDVTQMFLTPGRYALRVEGDSMIDEGIYDGDLIICQHSDYAEDGQIVVALIDGESATLKRLQRDNANQVTLLPANAQHQPQTYSSDRVTIQGVYVGLLRFSN